MDADFFLLAQAGLLALSAIAAAVSALASRASVKEARAAREDESFRAWRSERIAALEKLGEELLALADPLDRARRGMGGGPQDFERARLRAEHAFNLALHPDAELDPIVKVLSESPRDLRDDDLKRALDAVNQSMVQVGDSQRRLPELRA